MFWCDKCKIWEHEKCLADAIRRDYIKSNWASAAGKMTHKSFGKTYSIDIRASDATGEVTAYIRSKRRNVKTEFDKGNGQVKTDETSDIDTDESGIKASILVKCLKCGAQLK